MPTGPIWRSRPVRPNAAPDRGNEPRANRRGSRQLAAARHARRLRPLAARAADGAADRRQGDGRRDRLATHPPGFYGTPAARRALNVSAGIAALEPIAGLPSDVGRQIFCRGRETDLRPPLLTAALLLALADLVIAYALRGLLRRRPARIAALVALMALGLTPAARADDAFVFAPPPNCTWPMCAPGTRRLMPAEPGRAVGLDEALNRRTAVETGAPLAVDIETDDLIFFPLIYWPVTATEPPLSPAAVDASTAISKPAARSCSTPAMATSSRRARSAAPRSRPSGCVG